MVISLDLTYHPPPPPPQVEPATNFDLWWASGNKTSFHSVALFLTVSIRPFIKQLGSHDKLPEIGCDI